MTNESSAFQIASPLIRDYKKALPVGGAFLMVLKLSLSPGTIY